MRLVKAEPCNTPLIVIDTVKNLFYDAAEMCPYVTGDHPWLELRLTSNDQTYGWTIQVKDGVLANPAVDPKKLNCDDHATGAECKLRSDCLLAASDIQHIVSTFLETDEFPSSYKIIDEIDAMYF